VSRARPRAAEGQASLGDNSARQAPERVPTWHRRWLQVATFASCRTDEALLWRVGLSMAGLCAAASACLERRRSRSRVGRCCRDYKPRKHFQGCADSKAVDFIAVRGTEAWLVEVKDVTQTPPGPHRAQPWEAVTRKVRDSLAGALAGAWRADPDERESERCWLRPRSASPSTSSAPSTSASSSANYPTPLTCATSCGKR
jgi:hypothetical protein